MPRKVCPVCGTCAHVNTGNPVGFEALHPELLQVGLAIRECVYCAAELSVGDQVSVVNAIMQRPDHSAVPLGSCGSIVKIARTDAGHAVYRVDLVTGGPTNFLRGEIHKQ